ncbi:VQ motif-containing protein 4-like [Diospyros lotus]|uniref:VQ motif-containing protein 4-like n=1 Tax=Diospyros lotus TaxID=55363 RepID=UPI00224F19BA|nr:VQ motif-containing protein 4-like [Diospyros lotus]
MEITSRLPDRENPSPINSPNSNGAHPQTPPLTPKPVSRSETSPYPTTFIQADATTFKQVVQMLTGSAETAKQASNPPPPSKGYIPPVKTGQKKQNFKLYERRNNLKNGLMISLLIPGLAQNSGFSPRKQEILSPSLLDFPSLVLSPVTPLTEDPFNKASSPVGSSSEEEKAIAEKGFYLHPSPRTTPGAAEPRLLPLFPVTSPRVSESSS